eukprot:707039-Rhodomonas_salina.1
MAMMLEHSERGSKRRGRAKVRGRGKARERGEKRTLVSVDLVFSRKGAWRVGGEAARATCVGGRQQRP